MLQILHPPEVKPEIRVVGESLQPFEKLPLRLPIVARELERQAAQLPGGKVPVILFVRATGFGSGLGELLLIEQNTRPRQVLFGHRRLLLFVLAQPADRQKYYGEDNKEGDSKRRSHSPM